MGMGVDLNNGVEERGGRRRHRSRPMAEINVTPFVDVMLVLLIIFMVTAPLMTVGVPVELPKTDASEVKSDNDNPLIVSIDGKGRIFLMETEMSMDEMVPKLTAIAKNGLNERIYVRGDKNLMFGEISRVMGRISGAGFKHITVITDTAENG
jgi:biopolymer transport protein TolR